MAGGLERLRTSKVLLLLIHETGYFPSNHVRALSMDKRKGGLTDSRAKGTKPTAANLLKSISITEPDDKVSIQYFN